MATIIKTTKASSRVTSIPVYLAKRLPFRLTDEIGRTVIGGIEEIRLRGGRNVYLTVAGENRKLQTVMSGEEIGELVGRFCDGSLYAHRHTIAQGFLSLPGGIRVGICGRASVEEDSILGIYDISGLNIRLPARINRLGGEVCRLLEGCGQEGVLIYAPPGEGKTTLLRCVAARMASGDRARRVAVIDTRGELGFGLEDPSLCLDILVGYPRALGVEIASRTMNAQLIVCDEIGEREEAEAMVSAQNCGVPFVASAHGDSVQSLLRRTGIRLLHQARVFGYYVGIRRCLCGGEFQYTVTGWEEANGNL